MATINEALKKLFLGLGGDPDELKDNNTVSDYIDDLESAIETAASGASAELIDDEEASTTKTYSSSKIASLIPENELPTPAAADIGKVVSVISDGESGAEYALETPSSGGGDAVKSQRVLSVTITGDNIATSLVDVTRQDIIDFVTLGNQSEKVNITAYLVYMSSDYSTIVQGEFLLTGIFSAGANSLPIFSGIMPAGGATGALYQMYYMMGATAADDRFEIIPLTTT